MDVFLMVEIKIVPFYPALMIQGEQKSLVVTDLHLGFEDNLSLNNISVGKNTTTLETIKEIEKILDMTQPDSIILLGDIKSGIKSITKSEWKDVPLFFEKIIERDSKNTQLLSEKGYKVLRFWEHEIMKSPEKCFQKIIKIIKESRRQRG